VIAHFLEFEEVIRVGEDDTELVCIWGSASMFIIESRNGFTNLVIALALDASRDATVIDRFLEVGRRV
jgi:hypothetical protein